MALQVEGICTLLQVFDMPRSVAFYRDVLGFEIVQRSRPDGELDWALLRHGGAELMLNTMYQSHERPLAPDPARVAAHGDTSMFLGCADLDAAYAHIRAQGIEVAPPVVRDYGMRQLGLVDPDGYGICLQWPAA